MSEDAKTAAQAAIAVEEERVEKLLDSKTWDPKEGDDLYGVLLDGKWVTTQFGDTRVLNVEDDDGQVWTVWASNKMLALAVERLAPKLGSYIGIKFSGLKDPKTPGGRQYKMFTLHAPDPDHEYWKDQFDLFNAAGNEGMSQTEFESSGLAPDSGDMEDPF